MLIPVRIETYNKLCGSVPQAYCPACRQYSTFNKIRNKTTGRVIWIPVITKTNQAYLICTDCGAVYAVSKKGFDSISTAADVQKAIRGEEQKQAQLKTEYLEAGFSSKNHTLTVVLAALLTSLGVPFFYIGKPLQGILCLIASLVSAGLGLFPIEMAIVWGGFVFAFLIWKGKIKDKDGKYIVSEKQKKLLLQNKKSRGTT